MQYIYHMTAQGSGSKLRRIQLALLAIAVGVAVLAIKYYAAAVSGSAALKSDAIESIVNVVAAIFTLFAVLYAEKPADRGHPYGHGKIEHCSEAFEGGLIALAAVFIGWEALGTLHEQLVLEHFKIKDLGSGLVWNFVGGALNGALGLFLLAMGRRHRSKAIEADAQHVLSDFWTTLGILAGLLLVKATGIYWLDPLMALLVGALLALTGFKLVRRSAQALLDIEDPKLLENLIEAMNRVRPNDVIALHELRTMRSGRYTHVDIHVVMPGHYPLSKNHDLVEHFGKEAILEAGVEGELHTHIDPCQQALCKDCAVDECTLRQAPKGQPMLLTLEGSTALGDV
jgi:cation diffusion facilitator family transporter